MDSIVGTFSILIFTNKLKFYQQYLILKSYHDSNRSNFDQENSVRVLRLSKLIFHGTKLLCGSPMIGFYIVVPVIKTFISGNCIDLIAMPFQIIFLEGDKWYEILINVVHQMGTGVLTFIYVFFISSHVIIYVAHCILKSNDTWNLFNKGHKLEYLDDMKFEEWQLQVINATNDLKE